MAVWNCWKWCLIFKSKLSRNNDSQWKTAFRVGTPHFLCDRYIPYCAIYFNQLIYEVAITTSVAMKHH